MPLEDYKLLKSYQIFRKKRGLKNDNLCESWNLSGTCLENCKPPHERHLCLSCYKEHPWARCPYRSSTFDACVKWNTLEGCEKRDHECNKKHVCRGCGSDTHTALSCHIIRNMYCWGYNAITKYEEGADFRDRHKFRICQDHGFYSKDLKCLEQHDGSICLLIHRCRKCGDFHKFDDCPELTSPCKYFNQGKCLKKDNPRNPCRFMHICDFCFETTGHGANTCRANLLGFYRTKVPNDIRGSYFNPNELKYKMRDGNYDEVLRRKNNFTRNKDLVAERKIRWMKNHKKWDDVRDKRANNRSESRESLNDMDDQFGGWVAKSNKEKKKETETKESEKEEKVENHAKSDEISQPAKDTSEKQKTSHAYHTENIKKRKFNSEKGLELQRKNDFDRFDRPQDHIKEDQSFGNPKSSNTKRSFGYYRHNSQEPKYDTAGVYYPGDQEKNRAPKNDTIIVRQSSYKYERFEKISKSSTSYKYTINRSRSRSNSPFLTREYPRGNFDARSILNDRDRSLRSSRRSPEKRRERQSPSSERMHARSYNRSASFTGKPRRKSYELKHPVIDLSADSDTSCISVDNIDAEPKPDFQSKIDVSIRADEIRSPQPSAGNKTPPPKKKSKKSSSSSKNIKEEPAPKTKKSEKISKAEEKLSEQNKKLELLIEQQKKQMELQQETFLKQLQEIQNTKLELSSQALDLKNLSAMNMNQKLLSTVQTSLPPVRSPVAPVTASTITPLLQQNIYEASSSTQSPKAPETVVAQEPIPVKIVSS